MGIITYAPHCGHNLKPRRLIVYTSHSTLLACIVFWSAYQRSRSIQEIEQFKLLQRFSNNDPREQVVSYPDQYR